MSQYFIKRGEKIHGPFSTKQVKSGLESGKLKDADLISESKEGPWQTVTVQFQEPAPVVEVISKDLPTGEDNFFENVEIPAVATPVAQFPTPTKKNEDEATEQGEDTNNNEDNSNLVVCPDCNKQVSKRAASCPHCGAPLKAFNVDDTKVKAKAMFGVLKQNAASLKEKAEANPSIAGAMSKAKEVARKIEAFKDGKKLEAAYAREKREEQRNQKQQKKERLRAEALAKQEALRQSKQREREELIRIEAEQAAIRQKHENEFRAARNQLPDSAHQWLAKANAEDYWVRKDFYHLRAYTEAYLAGEDFFCKPAQQLVLEADQHDNFEGATRNIWYAIFYSLEAKYGPSQKAKRIFDQVNSTDVWNGMSYYSLLAILELLCEHFPSTAALARSEHEKHQRHDAWLCAHYYTLRAIITLLHGKIDDHPRYSAYFEDIENNYDVWQALVSCTIELFVEVNVFAEKP